VKRRCEPMNKNCMEAPASRASGQGTDHCPIGGAVEFKIMIASRGADGHHLGQVALGERFIAPRRSAPVVKRWDALMLRQRPPAVRRARAQQRRRAGGAQARDAGA